MSEYFEKIKKDCNELEEKFEREHKERMGEMVRKSDELDEKSAKNFNSWRDFLYRYFVFVMAFVGGSGIFQKIENLNNNCISWGVWLGLIGVIVGFLGINLHFYFERKRFQIEHPIIKDNPYELFEHSESGGDLVKAIKLNLQDKINKYKEEIKNLKNNKKNRKEIKKLKDLIKGDKKTIKLLKYYGGMFGWVEKFWFISVFVSVFLSLLGIVLILFKLL